MGMSRESTGTQVDTESLSRQVGSMLRENGLTLAAAESCTAGLVSASIVDVPGSSEVFLGAVVAYNDDVKRRVLGVQRRVLERKGAVSADAALAMARGARRLFKADVAVAVTGIAGPVGGTLDKPVGLTYIAVCSAQGSVCQRYVWAGERRENRELSARAALELLQAFLQRSGPAQGAAAGGTGHSQDRSPATGVSVLPLTAEPLPTGLEQENTGGDGRIQ